MTHTKGEWRVELKKTWYFDSCAKFYWIKADRPIADRIFNKANAKRIVQCVNSHDELVEALEFVLSNEGKLPDGRISTDCIVKITLALQSAKGGE